jgi:hypothetical protein
MLAATDLLYALVDEDDSLVAFGRVLTDRIYVALTLDVIVAPALRRAGPGSLLVEHICADPALTSGACEEPATASPAPRSLRLRSRRSVRPDR